MIVVMVYLLFGMTHSVSGMAIWNLGRYMLCRWWQSAEDKVRSETSRDVYLQCDSSSDIFTGLLSIPPPNNIAATFPPRENNHLSNSNMPLTPLAPANRVKIYFWKEFPRYVPQRLCTTPPRFLMSWLGVWLTTMSEGLTLFHAFFACHNTNVSINMTYDNMLFLRRSK